MPAQPNIGTAIKRARERKRWTQRQLADAVGVDIKSVDNWENSRTRPRSSIGALEQVLGIDLTGGEDQADPDEWERWERWVTDNPDLPERIKEAFIRGSRDARSGSGPSRSPGTGRTEDPGRQAG